MNVGIIDADLISIPKKPRSFPNLACMKLSGYHKKLGNNVELLLNYHKIDSYDKVYISKVFTESNIPDVNTFFECPILEKTNVEYGGTGFFFDMAPSLPYEIEHHMPDYSLYSPWVSEMVKKGEKIERLGYYTDFSIGFMTRGCFRKCQFCVNRNFDKVVFNAHVNEFLDHSKKGISLWDDNILGYEKWNDVFDELISTDKPFEFKQGMDIRLLTDKKAKVISSCKYHGHYIFAFDNINDREQIEKKLILWRNYVNPKRVTKLFILCGFDKENRYDEHFWIKDITDTFERIRILMLYGCVPFIMRYNLCNGPYKSMYQNINDWCNSVSNYMKKSFREICLNPRKGKISNTYFGVMNNFEKKFPDIAKKYFDLKREEIILNREWI